MWMRCLTFLAVTMPGLVAFADEPAFDLVIKGGHVVDGTGNPWNDAAIAVRGDQIVRVGKVSEAEVKAAKRVIEAAGLVVAPGFIDMHSHSDRTLLDDGSAPSKIRQGVTTEILGEQTSGGPFLDALTPQSVTVAGKTHAIGHLSDYLDALDASGIAPNIATYVGLRNVWGSVMGDSFARPTPEQFVRMKKILADAMEDGAFGLSNALASPDATVVTTDDLVELARVLVPYDGIYSSHIRNEGTDVLKAVDEAISIGERAKVRVDILHIKIAERSIWGQMNLIVKKIDAARARYVNVQANIYPYTRGNNDLLSIVPPWAHEGGKKALIERLHDPAQRKRVVAEIQKGLPGWYNHYTAVGGDWSRMLISAQLSEKNKKYQGQTMDMILRERTGGKAADPATLVDAMLDFLIEENGTIGTIYAHHDEADMNLALIQPWCSVGSDGTALATEGTLRTRGGHPHPRSFGTFPRVLGAYVRERGVLRLEDAVRKMTSLNASKVGIADRGLLKPGMKADVTVFDPRRVIDKATYLEPFQYPEGIEYVIVNGQPVLDRGKPTGAKPGRTLRRGKIQ